MKSNRYVYPTTDFADLSDKKIRNNIIKEKEIGFYELKKILKLVKRPEIKLKGSDVSEMILNIFLDKECLFGPANFINDYREHWKKKFEYFITRKKPIKMAILGFPFKMPVPLKTDKKLPDMGEVLSLLRLASIAANIKNAYKKGAVIYVFTEGGFGSFAGVKKNDWKKYEKYLKIIVKKLGLSDRIKILALSQMEKLPEFRGIFQKRYEENKRAMEANDAEFMEKFKEVYMPMFRIVNTEKYDQRLLMDVYNEHLGDSVAAKDVVSARNEIRGRTIECIMKYFAYLKTRDDLDFIERKVKNYIALSVSPKPMRLGIIPVNKKCVRLPYHGVPVYHKEKKTWSIEYLIDLRRDKKKYVAVFWSGDGERRPFYYIES